MLCTKDQGLINKIISRRDGELYKRARHLEWGYPLVTYYRFILFFINILEFSFLSLSVFKEISYIQKIRHILLMEQKAMSIERVLIVDDDPLVRNF